jgi:hypothetical protein
MCLCVLTTVSAAGTSLSSPGGKMVQRNNISMRRAWFEARGPGIVGVSRNITVDVALACHGRNGAARHAEAAKAPPLPAACRQGGSGKITDSRWMQSENTSHAAN